MSEQSEQDTIRGVQIRAGVVYICMKVRVPYSSACHTYIMWAELDHCHFLYVQAVLNVVTTGNGTGTKNVLKWNRALGFELSDLAYLILEPTKYLN